MMLLMIIPYIYNTVELVIEQFINIFPYWAVGVIIGSVVSVFGTGKIVAFVAKLQNDSYVLRNITIAALLGAASPVCMYGTIPLIASLGKKNIPQYLLAAFMISSILINPNLFIFSFALGAPVALLRLLMCLLAGIIAGLLIYFFFRRHQFFNFNGFERTAKQSKSPTFRVLLADIHKAVIITAPYFLAGILLTALFEVIVPKDAFISLFGGHKELGVILAASLGVPVYLCGGGTIPILKAWLSMGMSPGAAIAFMLSGAATKITNLSAVKIILGFRNFVLYIVFNMFFAMLSGWVIDAVYYLIL